MPFLMIGNSAPMLRTPSSSYPTVASPPPCDRFGLELRSRLIRGQRGFGGEVVAFDIIEARAAGRRQGRSAGKPARLLVDGGDLEIGRASHPHLRDAAAAA